MATDLKNCKILRPFMDTLLALTFLTVALGICLARPALLPNLTVPEVWAGNPIGVPDFRDFMVALYNNYAMVLNGPGDDTGTPLNASATTQSVKEQAKTALESQLRKVNSDLLLYNRANTAYSNYQGGSLFAESDGHLTLPAGDTLLFSITADETLYANTTLLNAYLGAPLQNRPAGRAVPLVIALPAADDEPQTQEEALSPGFVAECRQTARQWQRDAWGLLACLSLAGVFGLRRRLCPASAPQSRRAALALTGRVWTEAKLGLLVMDGFALLVFCRQLWDGGNTFLWWLPAGRGLLVLLSGAVCLFYLLLFDGWGNRRRLWQGSLVYKMLAACHRALCGLRARLPWQRRALVFSALGAICLPVLALAGAGLVGWYTAQIPFWQAGAGWLGLAIAVFCLLSVAYWIECILTSLALTREATRLADKAVALQQGSLSGAADAPLPAERFRLMGQSATALNELESGIATAVEQQMRAERLKVELISNVSHDLKTPLTSMINYADLLCGEELSPAAADYAHVLQKKAYQLKGMVQDVFELSKATSGNLPIAPEPLDFAKLLRQTLADMDDAIAASSLTFRAELPAEAWVVADGQRLYRVFQNLIDNALRYSLEGSRVYLRLAVENSRAVATVKNVSRFEMDFAPEDIVERFARADSSRTTAGSGLGLSIAKSFTEACGGEFALSLDADLFCAAVSLPLAEKPIPPENDTPENDAPKKDISGNATPGNDISSPETPEAAPDAAALPG